MYWLYCCFILWLDHSRTCMNPLKSFRLCILKNLLSTSCQTSNSSSQDALRPSKISTPDFTSQIAYSPSYCSPSPVSNCTLIHILTFAWSMCSVCLKCLYQAFSFCHFLPGFQSCFSGYQLLSLPSLCSLLITWLLPVPWPEFVYWFGFICHCAIKTASLATASVSVFLL